MKEGDSMRMRGDVKDMGKRYARKKYFKNNSSVPYFFVFGAIQSLFSDFPMVSFIEKACPQVICSEVASS